MKTERELKREAGGQPRNGDHLLAAELSAEQNMNMLDGIPNNEKPRVNQNWRVRLWGTKNLSWHRIPTRRSPM